MKNPLEGLLLDSNKNRGTNANQADNEKSYDGKARNNMVPLIKVAAIAYNIFRFR